MMLIIQEKKSSNQLVMAIVNQESLTISNLIKQIVKGRRGAGLLYTGYALASKNEKIIVNIKIVRSCKNYPV